MEWLNKTAKRASATSLGALLNELLAARGLAHTLGGWRAVTTWPEIVGAKVASISRAVRFVDDTLIVSVPDSSWRCQLSMESDCILEKIRDIPGGKVVRRIHFTS
jgi:predicted nucleic acid-binding Zn ribbon protein